MKDCPNTFETVYNVMPGTEKLYFGNLLHDAESKGWQSLLDKTGKQAFTWCPSCSCPDSRKICK